MLDIDPGVNDVDDLPGPVEPGFCERAVRAKSAERAIVDRALQAALEEARAVAVQQAAARERGLVRSEGKEYVMRDGDVVTFRFNV
jgi:ketosteroid isomerase-like protein